ncbi:MAG: glycosyltransferase family 2 protein [Nocardioidaceae bacterium]|nr:glycosyltransferase family 2 protein [Nocardioidaceae bacterium]
MEDQSGATAAVTPDVTVITPAYNAMPYIRRTLQSLVDQTIGHDRMEVVVVDDGSSDGTGEELDRWSQDYPGLFRIVHQEASGGPAGPRNVALDMARGRFVFFLDADDYLGEESLARLVAMADENDSDVVLGKMVGLGGRGVAQSMFRKSVADADLFRSRVWWTLSVLKLYRRSLIEENALRFPTEFRTTSDQPFAGLAYLRARKISVEADYDHYYVVRPH